MDGERLFDRLKREAEYAKTTAFPRESLFRVYGRASMAAELKAITVDEYMTLNNMIVTHGINVPAFSRETPAANG